MKMHIILCTVLSHLVIGSGCYLFQEAQMQRAASQQSVVVRHERQWRPAVYMGLTMGQSTRDDMLRVFGEPQWSGQPADQMKDDPAPEIWYEYAYGGDFPGKLTVVTDQRSGLIKAIDLNPTNLTKQAAIEHFGPSFIITRYAFDQCLGNEESAPVYESPNGQLVNIEYRELGIAIAIGDDGNVLDINYVSEPIGATSSKCQPKKRQSSARSHP
jgi:hypothetical protein